MSELLRLKNNLPRYYSLSSKQKSSFFEKLNNSYINNLNSENLMDKANSLEMKEEIN